MNVLEYIKIKGQKYLAWATKQDVQTYIDKIIGAPTDKKGNPTTISAIVEEIRDNGGGGGGGFSVVQCTLPEYRAMEKHDPNTYYFITNLTDDDEAREL